MGVEMIEAGWMSILPPLIAIILALKTKEDKVRTDVLPLSTCTKMTKTMKNL